MTSMRSVFYFLLFGFLLLRVNFISNLLDTAAHFILPKCFVQNQLDEYMKCNVYILLIFTTLIENL